MTAAAHVVFGTGPAGRAVASALLDRNQDANHPKSNGLAEATTEKVTP